MRLMIIRPAIPQDSLALAMIQVNSYRTAYAPILPAKYLEHFTIAEQEKDWQDWFTTDTHEILKVAVDRSGELAGYALGKHNRIDLPPYQGELVALHVRQSTQRQGVGLQLMIAVAESLRMQGCDSLFLWVLDSNPARLFYEKLGGSYVAAKPWQNNQDFGVNISEVAYGWPDIRTLTK